MRLHPVKRGRSAELIFLAKCLEHGLDCFTPTTEDGRIDAVIGPHLYRCQVKVLGSSGYCGTKHLNLVKRRGPVGSQLRFRYSKEDVDFMIGVCVDTHTVYVVPIASTEKWSNSISEQSLREMGTADALHLLTIPPGGEFPLEPPKPLVGRRPKTRRPSRAWVDTTSLSLDLEFDDDQERRRRVG